MRQNAHLRAQNCAINPFFGSAPRTAHNVNYLPFSSDNNNRYFCANQNLFGFISSSSSSSKLWVCAMNACLAHRVEPDENLPPLSLHSWLTSLMLKPIYVSTWSSIRYIRSVLFCSVLFHLFGMTACWLWIVLLVCESRVANSIRWQARYVKRDAVSKKIIARSRFSTNTTTRNQNQ